MTTASAQAPAAPGSLERARLSVSCGPLARTLAGRFVAALGAETALPLDRVEEAYLLAEAVADRCGELTPDGELELSVAVHDDRLELRVGPLERGAAHRLLGADAGRKDGGAIRGLASTVETRPLRGGDREVLVIVVTAHPRG
jgi:hypothetical protein